MKLGIRIGTRNIGFLCPQTIDRLVFSLYGCIAINNDRKGALGNKMVSNQFFIISFYY